VVTYCSHGLLRYKAKPGPARPGPKLSPEAETLLPGTVVLHSPNPPSGDDASLLQNRSFVVVEAIDGPNALLLRKVGCGRTLVSRQRCLTMFPEGAATSPDIAWRATEPGDGDAQHESEPFRLLGLLWALRVSPEREGAEPEHPPRAASAEAPSEAAAAGGVDDDDGLAASLQVESNVELLRSILGDAFDESMLRDKTSREALREILVGAGLLPTPAADSPAPGDLESTVLEGAGAAGGGAAPSPTVSSSGPGGGPRGENNNGSREGSGLPERR
jgi:hypothetical protein